MYINKEDYSIYYNKELIKNVVDIDVQEVFQLGDEGIGMCRDILMVKFIGSGGTLLQVKDSAEKFSFKKRTE